MQLSASLMKRVNRGSVNGSGRVYAQKKTTKAENALVVFYLVCGVSAGENCLPKWANFVMAHDIHKLLRQEHCRMEQVDR